MKSILKHFLMFAGLTIALSSLNGCGNNAASNDAPNVSSKANTNANTVLVSSTDYPPLASGLANAEFSLLDGTKFKVADKKGKVILLNIWGTWCGPCRAEMPELKALQDKYRDREFEIIGLNIGEDDGSTPEPLDRVKKFVEQMELNYTIGISGKESSQQFYAVTKESVVPQSILIDRQGRLRGVFAGAGPRIYQSLRDSIEKVVNES